MELRNYLQQEIQTLKELFCSDYSHGALSAYRHILDKLDKGEFNYLGRTMMLDTIEKNKKEIEKLIERIESLESVIEIKDDSIVARDLEIIRWKSKAEDQVYFIDHLNSELKEAKRNSWAAGLKSTIIAEDKAQTYGEALDKIQTILNTVEL